MSNKILDAITIGLVGIIVAVAIAMYVKVSNPTKLYLTKYVSPETGVCYYVTDNCIIPIYNRDGTLYYEGGDSNVEQNL